MNRTRALVMISAVAALGVSACGGDDDSGDSIDPADLDGREFVSDDVEGFDLVAGTVVRLGFDGDSVGASAGCNSMSGRYELDGDEMTVPAMAMTEMGCEAALMEQDTWLAEVLTGPATISLDGDVLTVTSDAGSITATDREVAEPDLELVGPTWMIDGIVSNDAVSSLLSGSDATLQFDDDSVAVDTGCNTGSGSADVSGDTIEFGPLAVTLKACEEPAMEQERKILHVLSGEVTYEIESNRLSLTAGDGTGLTAFAER